MSHRFNMIKVLLLLSIFLFTTGCPTTGNLITYSVNGTRYATHELKGNERGNVLLLPAKKSFEGQLVYNNYAKAVSDYLTNNGLTVVKEDKDLKYVMFLNYGFISTRSVTMPQTIQAGKKSISINPEDYTSGTPLGIPSGYVYGTPTRTLFDRVIELEMYDVSKEKPQQVLTTKVTSRGQCGQISQLTEVLVGLLMENWPPKNGEAEKITNWKVRVNEC